MTAKTIARWTALGALFLIPLTPLLVADSYFFPFITGKGFFFRILAEIAFAAWAVLAFVDRDYRPRFSWIGVAVVAFVGWMFVANSFAPYAAKAFWSNFERMEGWVLLVHLLGFFFAAGAVLRVEKRWRAWFLASLGVSVVVCVHALMQLSGAAAIHQGSTRIDASFGNSAYLAIYLLFNVFIALWLALTEKRAWLMWVLVALAAGEGILIFFTETRGAIIGLTVGLTLAALLTALTAGKRARVYAGSAMIVIAVIVSGLYLARDSSFVQNNHTLQRITSISISDGKTRFTLWHMALEGVKERPVLGWGQEGYNNVFNKYYEPSLYGQEQWFDRAHNAFIDWIVAGGIPAFLFYLSLFGTAIVLLWKSSELSRPERIALTGALVGYAIHNLFVFDNLYSYIYFFALLALVDSQIGRPVQKIEALPIVGDDDVVTFVLPIASVVCIGLIWLVNISGMQVASKLIDVLSGRAAGVSNTLAAFEDLAAHPAFAAQEVREQLVSMASTIAQSDAATRDEKVRAVTLAVEEMKKQIAANPLDARAHLMLSYAYRAGGDMPDALEALNAALAQSPKKVGLWTERGVLEWEVGNVAEAQKSFNTAYELAGTKFPDLATYAAAGYIAVGDMGAADKILTDTFGTTLVDSEVLTVAYYRAKNWPRLIKLLTARAEKQDAPVEAWFSLGAAYYESGDRANALATIREAVKRFPSAAASAEAAIAQIEGRAGGK